MPDLAPHDEHMGLRTAPVSGVRCGAKNRDGSRCRRHPVEGKKRCRLHGGLSTGPKTAAGKLVSKRNAAAMIARRALAKLSVEAGAKREIAGEISRATAVVARARAEVVGSETEVRSSGLGDRLTELTGKSLDHIGSVFDRELPKGKRVISKDDKWLTRERSDLAKAVLKAQVASDQTAFMARRSAVLGEVVAALLGAEASAEDDNSSSSNASLTIEEA